MGWMIRAGAEKSASRGEEIMDRERELALPGSIFTGWA